MIKSLKTPHGIAYFKTNNKYETWHKTLHLTRKGSLNILKSLSNDSTSLLPTGHRYICH